MRRPSRLVLLLAVFTFVATAVPVPSRAQGAGSAMLRGTILDVTGAAVPGAALTLTSVRTRMVRVANAGNDGSYVFAALTTGPYRLRAEFAGFAPWESSEIHLSPGDTVQVDATLAVAGQTEEVDVVSEREMVRADHGSREGLITAAQIQNLSIVGRGGMELLRILPGSVTPDQSSMETVGFNFGGANNLGAYSVNANRGTNMSPVLDGSRIVDFGSNSGVMLNINPDMVEEVKVQTANYAAEYGSPSVQVSAVTKGGSASFHGSVYDYWRNWRFAANDRSNNYAEIPRPESNYHYPGFNLSGPVLVPGTDFNKDRDRLFFFVGFELQRQTIDQGTTLGVVPTLAQRQGDFSELLTGGGQNLGQPPIVTIPWGFPGAGLPAPNNDLSPYIDPTGRAFMSLYPLPNYSDPENRYNYAFNEPMPLNRWQLSSRIDWNVTGATHAYVRLALEQEDQRYSRGLWGDLSRYELPSRIRSDNKAWSVAVNVTSVLSPSLTNELVVSASQLELDNAFEDPSKVSKAAVGLEGYQGIFPSDSPEVPIGYASWGQNQGELWSQGGFPIFAHNDSVSLSDTVTKVLSTHTLKVGLFIERGQKQQNAHTNQGLFILGSSWIPGSTGNDYGDLLVGRLAQYQQTTARPVGEFRFWNFEGYVQDSWKVRRNLTLEAGLRVAKLTNDAELNGLGLRFEPSAYDFSQGSFIDGDPGQPNGVLLASQGEIPKGLLPDRPVIFLPRFNFAWDTAGDGDLVLRGGAGLFANRWPGVYYPVTSPPNSYNIDLVWWDVPGGLTISGLPEIAPWSYPAGWVDSVEPSSQHVPRTWSWSLALSKRLPWQQTVELAYVGHHASRLPNNTRLSYIPPGVLTGPYGNADLDNPLHRAAMSSEAVAAFRTFPAYNLNSWWYQNEAWSNYNALQVTLSRQAGGRVQYFLNYTFSKALGTTGDDYSVIDPIEPDQRSYGILPQDRTHIFNASYNVLLPDPIAADGPALLRGLLNGWQVSGITSYRSGPPFRVVFGGVLALEHIARAWFGTDAHLSGGQQNSGPMAPVFYGDPRLDNTEVSEKILDIEQIEIPALGESGPFQQPYYFRAPSRWNWDLTLMKNFPLGGSKRIQLRVGLFNLFNQAAPDVYHFPSDVNLDLVAECNVFVDGVPDGTGGLAYGVCDPTQGFHYTEDTLRNFGKIITKRGHRVIELAVRFDF